MKNLIINISKFLIAGGLIYWLFTSGKLDINAFKDFFRNPGKIIVAMSAAFVGVFINTFRWQSIIAKFERKKLPYKNVFLYGWIGLFFNTALPGIVSGDVIKAILLKKTDNDLSVKKLIASTFIDRLFGLSALITIMGVISIINYSTLAITPEIKHIIHLNFLIFTGLIIGIVFLFSSKSLHEKLISFIPHDGIKEKILSLLEYSENIKKSFHKYLFMSFLSQGIFVLTFFYLMNGEVELMKALTVIPLGFITLALPIAPGGIGVGHVLFEKLFAAFSISRGAIYFNNYFLLGTIVNLSGFIPYILSGNKSSELIKEADSIQ